LEALDNFSKYPPFPPINRIVLGVRGVPELYENPSGRISNEPEDREKKERN
jgi:hypothetical protein